MWPGPYGDWGSRKYLLASLDQSLKRMGLDYVDIFYSHRFDPDTPLEETMGALDTRCGRARRSTSASRPTRRSRRARRHAILRDLGTPFLIHQPSYSMLNRWIEDGAARHARRAGHRLHRLLAARPGHADRQVSRRDPGRLARRGKPALARPAHRRGAIQDARAERDRAGGAARRWRRWRSPGRSATRGSPRRSSGPAASSSSRRTSAALDRLDFTADELAEIDRHATESDINLWAASGRSIRRLGERATVGRSFARPGRAGLQASPPG